MRPLKKIENAICELKSDFQQNIEKMSLTQTQTKEQLQTLDSKIIRIRTEVLYTAIRKQKIITRRTENIKGHPKYHPSKY